MVGKARSGKDTCADLLCEIGNETNRVVKRVAFADPLKRIVSDIYCFAYDLPSSVFYGDGDDKDKPLEVLGGRSGREIQQFVGTECFRKLTPSIWTTYLVKYAVLLAQQGADLIVVTDVRFANEAKAVREMQGTLIRITRTSELRLEHQSETEQDYIDTDCELTNNGTLEDLKRSLRKFIT